MLTAIITQLKTLSIQTVFAKYDGVIPPKNKPYLYVWEAPSAFSDSVHGTGGFYVSYHTQVGKQDDISAYLNQQVSPALHKITLEDDLYSGEYFALEDSNQTSILITTNSDGTISKDRLFTIPIIGNY